MTGKDNDFQRDKLTIQNTMRDRNEDTRLVRMFRIGWFGWTKTGSKKYLVRIITVTDLICVNIPVLRKVLSGKFLQRKFWQYTTPNIQRLEQVFEHVV